MPLVSVIIPTYKHCDYVTHTLESVFAQSFTDFEVIIINDDSPDNTAAVMRPYVDSGRIRYFEQSNAGQAAARNRGLAEANGEFIAFLDDDDVWPPDKLEWQLKALLEMPDVGLVYGWAQLFGERTEVFPGKGQTPAVTFESMFDSCPIVSPGQALIRRKALDLVGGFDTTIWGVDDHDLYIRLSAITKLKYIPQPALNYRCHRANASNNVWRMYLNSRAMFDRNLEVVSPAARRQLRSRAARQMSGMLSRCIRQNALLQLRARDFGSLATQLLAYGCEFIRSVPARLNEKSRRIRILLGQLKPIPVVAENSSSNRKRHHS